jgi:hypothetical protein
MRIHSRHIILLHLNSWVLEVLTVFHHIWWNLSAGHYRMGKLGHVYAASLLLLSIRHTLVMLLLIVSLHLVGELLG